MARRLDKTLVDYLVIAISPALIMLLVGSLVFFLIEVFYQGNFQGRLEYIFGLFVFAAVLIARIAIEEGRERALIFALPLAVAVLMAVDRFVEFRGAWLGTASFLINCGLIGLVWWSSDKLTWDCTLIDEKEEDSGEGLLEAVGLDRPDKAALQKQITPVVESTGGQAAPATQGRAGGWWQRFIAHRRRPHAPGLSVVYFSLAALPLFGIGQIFIPSNVLASRQSAFACLFVYTASGLGLLLTTSFLGLRRYLRQRRQEMPLLMVNAWLGVGGVLIAGVMLAAMLLPRPNAEYAVSQLPFEIGSPDQASSPHGVGRDGVEEKKPWARGEKKDDKQPGSAPSDKQGKTPSPDAKSPPGDKQGGSGKDKTSGQRPNDKAQPPPGNQDEASRKEPSEGEKPRDARDKSDEEKQKEAKQDSEKDKKQPDRTPQRRSASRAPEKPSPAPRMPQVRFMPDVSPLMAILKCLLYVGLAILVLYAIWKNHRAIWAGIVNFWPWLVELWRSLFGGRARRKDKLSDDAELEKILLPRFVDFTDPFAAGTVGKYRPEELVRYTFEALEAWARDHGHPRQPEQTPHEFVRQVGTQVSSLATDTAQLAELYCQVAYAPGTLSAGRIERLPHLWQTMRAEAAPEGPAAGSPV